MIGEYYVLKTKRNASKLKQDLQDASQQLKGAYEAIFKDDKDSLQ